MLPEVESKGTVIALEFEKGCALDNYREAIEYINKTDRRIRITCDTYHLFNDRAEPYQAVLAQGELLVDVHLSGSHRRAPGSAGDQVGYRAFLRGLKEINYQGALVFQYHLDEPDSIRYSCEFIKCLLKEL